jgi:multicomponent Na+:H+ antiporter subunit A
LGFGLIPDWVSYRLIEPAVLAFHPTREYVALKMFYGLNEPLLLSVFTLTLGAVVYFARRWLRRTLVHLLALVPLSMETAYEGLLKATIAIAKWQTRRLQSGSLFQYLVVVIGATLTAVGGSLLHWGGPIRFDWRWPTFPTWLGLLLASMLLAIGIVVRARSRLLAICGLGVIGAGMAVLFLAFGAPDVGLTQLLVETLTLIIAAIILLRLPPIERPPGPQFAHSTLSLLVAVGSGVLVTVLMLAVNHHPLDRTITAFYEQASYLKAHGRNIVNVILVDFRSLDTLGEIIVVGVSALAALALIRGKGATS